MKFNWGTGIALFYTIFAAVLIFAVIKSTSYDNSLVSDQYYADDLKYQEHYVKLVNSKALTEDLKIVCGKTDVTLTFPEEVGAVQGEIVFFCPSDSKQDFTLPVRPDAERRQNVPIEGLKPGLWKVKVDWQANGKTYYKEETVVF
ncbi:MAG TPA: FixH family protein [Saprospiraceae bacterium]|nr:FixH family protein [Saprospiraceae bacterium]HMP25204.1 FixH family protein [Saprospiraceae bacterium]